MKNSVAESPIYSRVWQTIRQFPGIIHQGAATPPATSGATAALLFSGGIGAVTMMVVHHFSDVSKDIESQVKILGSWIPGAISPNPMWGNIGSYAGKQTAMLIGWLVSWVILYPLLRNRSVKSTALFFWLFGLYTLAAVMSWHPIFPYLPLQ
jgi:hypothetical protein